MNDTRELTDDSLREWFGDGGHFTTCEDCGAPPHVVCSDCWPKDEALEGPADA